MTPHRDKGTSVEIDPSRTLDVGVNKKQPIANVLPLLKAEPWSSTIAHKILPIPVGAQLRMSGRLRTKDSVYSRQSCRCHIAAQDPQFMLQCVLDMPTESDAFTPYWAPSIIPQNAMDAVR